jgi:hypothetical protein
MQADDLYGLPLDEFIAKRGELAKALRADGRRDEATAVTALRKPSVAAWAVNQLVRSQRKAIADLFASGDELSDTQTEVLAGRQDAAALRGAVEQERAAVDKLTELAHGLLTSGGDELSPAVAERVAETLHAAALDEQARAAVAGGRLERELRHVGLGGGLSATAAPAPRSRGAEPKPAKPKGAEPKSAKANGAKPKPAKPNGAKPPSTKPKGAKPKPAGRKPAPRADPKTADRTRTEARRAARIAEAETRRKADRAARALKIARERRQRAAQALEEAERALDGATNEARAADDAHARARKQLDAL